MRIIFLGDVVGEPGRQALKIGIPELIETHAPDFIIVNGENAAGGHGITPKLAYELFRYKIDVITLGDHVWDQKDLPPFFAEEPRLLRPFNYPKECPGNGHIVVTGNGLKLGVINAMGRTFMNVSVDNPFNNIEPVISEIKKETSCILIDFHAETTSEKNAFGWMLDGRVSAILGTHTHIQTADEKILPQGTAYITDVGFCGSHDSVLGSDKFRVIDRFKSCMPHRMTIALNDNQVNGVFLELDDTTGKATRIERLQHPIKE